MTYTSCCERSHRGYGLVAKCVRCLIEICSCHLYVDELGASRCYKCGESNTLQRVRALPSSAVIGHTSGRPAERVCWIAVHALQPCGAVRNALELAGLFKAAGYYVVVLSGSGGGQWFDRAVRIADAVVISWGWHLFEEPDWRSVLPVTADFVSAHHLPTIKWLAATVAELPPIVGHVHTMATASDISRDQVEHLLAKCARIVFPTRTCLEQYRSLVKDSSIDTYRRKCAVLPNFVSGFSIDLHAESHRFDHFGTPGLRVAIVSRLDTDKIDWNLLVSVMKQLHDYEPRLRFLLAGFGEDSAETKRRVSMKKLDQICLFAGHVEEIESVYLWADVVFLPSAYEVMPYAPLEADYFGVPCVAPDFGYKRELRLVGASNIRLFTKGATDAVHLIIAALKQPEREDRFAGRLARQHRASSERCVKAIRNIFGGFLDRKVVLSWTLFPSVP